MSIYTFIDFCKSKVGHTILFSCFLLILFLGLGHHLKGKQERENQRMSELQELGKSQLWHDTDSQEKPLTAESEDDLTLTESKPNYRPFRPVTAERSNAEAQSKQNPQRPSTKVTSVANTQPLILAERKSRESHTETATAENDQRTQQRPAGPTEEAFNLKSGTLLYCQLATPVSSDQGDAPVMLKLTRAFVRKGRVILPIGTKITGTLASWQNERFFFSQDWQAQLPNSEWTKLRGTLQQADYDPTTKTYGPHDGLAGLPAPKALQRSSPKTNRWEMLLEKAMTATGELARKRAIATIEDSIPSVLRSEALNTSEEMTGELLLPEIDRRRNSQNSSVNIPAGQSVYLTL